MKFGILTVAAALAGFSVGTACAQPAQETPVQTQAPMTKSGNVCLRTIDIQNTTIPDEHTILFHMRNGKVWKNTLKADCPGLRFNGFAYTATPPNQICGNLQSIRAIQSGSVCLLGPFEPYTPPPKNTDANGG